MIPDFDPSGLLPVGVHNADWAEVLRRFGYNPQRQWLLGGLHRALLALRQAGCLMAYLDGSFVTSKVVPGDYDLCWSLVGVNPALLDPVLVKFDDGRRAMKAKYLGDLFPAEWGEAGSGTVFFNFFQLDKGTGVLKGIVMIDLWSVP